MVLSEFLLKFTLKLRIFLSLLNVHIMPLLTHVRQILGLLMSGALGKERVREEALSHPVGLQKAL